MTVSTALVGPTDTAQSEDLRTMVGSALRHFLDTRAEDLLSIGPVLEPVVAALRDFLLNGGKRLRPAFCYWGWRGAGGMPGDTAVIGAAASLELLHACGLIHDDIIDASDTRRGQPAVHRRFAQLHHRDHLRGSADGFGTAAAILLGDMCMTWCDQMFDENLPPTANVRAAKKLFHLMHTEVLAGQYLDALEQSLDTVSLSRAMTVIRYKTACYTVVRPLQLGALLAGADDELLASYSRFAMPLGEAFQLRDDVLGVFGDSSATGKPTGDDLREGKHTVLLALARDRATGPQRGELDRLVGEPALTEDGVDILRSIIIDTGALRDVEAQIDARMSLVRGALSDARLTEEVRAALTELAIASTKRSA